VSAKVGKFQILINNAAPICAKTSLISRWRMEGRNRIRILTSVFLACRAFVAAHEGSGYGRILNMTSIMAHFSSAAYAILRQKAALLGLTKSLALELAIRGLQ